MNLSNREKLEQAYEPYHARCTWKEREGKILLIFDYRKDWQNFLAKIKSLGLKARGSYHRKELMVFLS